MRSSRTSSSSASVRRFIEFYRTVFVKEHEDLKNVALHVVGVIGSLAFVPLALTSRAPWLALAYPVVHVLPGLVGHRLFERSSAVGDVRVTRKDYPLWWFLVANHWLAFDALTGRLRPPAPR